jgi:hypothetical protein
MALGVLVAVAGAAAAGPGPIASARLAASKIPSGRRVPPNGRRVRGTPAAAAIAMRGPVGRPIFNVRIVKSLPVFPF